MIVKNVNHKLEEKIAYVEDNRKGGGGFSIAAETTLRYQAYQAFLISILKTQ